MDEYYIQLSCKKIKSSFFQTFEVIFIIINVKNNNDLSSEVCRFPVSYIESVIIIINPGTRPRKLYSKRCGKMI